MSILRLSTPTTDNMENSFQHSNSTREQPMSCRFGRTRVRILVLFRFLAPSTFELCNIIQYCTNSCTILFLPRFNLHVIASAVYPVDEFSYLGGQVSFSSILYIFWVSAGGGGFIVWMTPIIYGRSRLSNTATLELPKIIFKNLRKKNFYTFSVRWF